LTLRVANTAEALEPARLAVLQWLDALPGPAAPPRLRYRLELVLEEMLMNRVWHAWPEGGLHHSTLAVQRLDDALQLDFSDDGIAFDPFSADPPPRPATLQQATPGGLGLVLLRRAARACQYRREAGHNHCRIELDWA
jgi:sigma-B regulation protein RsbU (phosphoserine phosphatase)